MTRTEAERAASADYSARVRVELARVRMTQVELARRAGMAESVLRRRMSGAAVWSATELAAVARVLEVSMETLTGGEQA